MTGAGVVTVADLLNRNAPVPVEFDDEDDTGRGISVGSLLRREGRAPHAIDRPIQPRAHQQADDDAGAEPATDRHARLRRGTIAAGTLLAAGSVIGAAILTEVGPTTGTDALDPPTDGTYPGQGLLDPDNPLGPPVGTVQLDQAASINTLDPGTAAPTSWVPIAFPSALAGVPTGTAAAAAADAAAGAAGGGDGGGSGSGTGGGTRLRRRGRRAGAAAQAPPRPGGGWRAASASDDQQGAVGDLGDGLGDTANGLGDALGGGPVGDTVGGLGDTVNDTTDALDGAVGGLLGGGDDDNADNDDDDNDSDDKSDVPTPPRAPTRTTTPPHRPLPRTRSRRTTTVTPTGRRAASSAPSATSQAACSADAPLRRAGWQRRRPCPAGPAPRPACGPTPTARARSGWTAGSCAARSTRGSPRSSPR